MKKLKKQMVSKVRSVEAYAICACAVAGCGCVCTCNCVCQYPDMTHASAVNGHAGGYNVIHQMSYTNVNGSQSGRA